MVQKRLVGRITLSVLGFVCCGELHALSLRDVMSSGRYLYQDIVVNGEIVKKGERDCAPRYEVIKEFLAQYERPFTVLDLGANKGYFSLHAAHDFPHGTFVMVEGDHYEYTGIARELLNLCRMNTERDNLIFLKKLVKLDDLRRLSDCEHFDVTFAFNIFHHFGTKQWKEVIDAVLDGSDHVIVENPPQETVAPEWQNKLRQDIEDYLYSQGGKLLAKVKRHTSDSYSSMIVVSRPRGFLRRNIWFKPYVKDGDYVITSDFKKKILTKPFEYPKLRQEDVEWHRGINLVTFKMMNGVYPEIDTVKALVREMTMLKTNDWVVSNMILQGSRMVLIDCDDLDRWGHVIIPFSQLRLQKTLAWIDLTDPVKLDRGYWVNLVGADRPMVQV